jgi:hypothetical protein
MKARMAKCKGLVQTRAPKPPRTFLRRNDIQIGLNPGTNLVPDAAWAGAPPAAPGFYRIRVE